MKKKNYDTVIPSMFNIKKEIQSFLVRKLPSKPVRGLWFPIPIQVRLTYCCKEKKSFKLKNISKLTGMNFFSLLHIF